MTTDTAEKTSVATVKNELTVSEVTAMKKEHHSLNSALCGGDAFIGYESDFVSRALTERNHPMFKGFSPN